MHIHKLVLSVFILLFSGCSINNLFVPKEVNKVFVVRYSTYMKHHRAYFTRSHLKRFSNNKYYRWLYNKKTNSLAILLHQNKHYKLYTMSTDTNSMISIRTNHLSKALNAFKKRGFRSIKSLASIGRTSHFAYKIFKEHKVLEVETRNFYKLQKLYKHAIKHYNSSKVRQIKTTLPKTLIHTYYKSILAKTKKEKHLHQLAIIAKCLDLTPPVIQEKSIPKKHSLPTKSPAKIKPIPKSIPEHNISIVKTPMLPNVDIKPEPTEIEQPKCTKKIIKKDKPYLYYLTKATPLQIEVYLNREDSNALLTKNEIDALLKRKEALEEKALLKNASIETLIAAYKKNKKIQFKQRILELIKQDKESKKLTL